MNQKIPTLFKRSCMAIATLVLLVTVQPAVAQDFVWAPDFPVGTAVPPIEALDQNGELKTLEQLNGEKGVLLMFSRSFSW